MSVLVTASCWGLLPLALLFAVVVTVRLGMLVVPAAPAYERLLAGAVLTVGGLAVGVRLLGAAGALRASVALPLLAVVALGLEIAARRRGRPLALPWRRVASRSTAALLLVALGAVVLASAAAYLLPIWQWDALGYHLPYVAFVLQEGSFGGVPVDVPYLTTYPHVVELLFAGWRLMLPDDRLVDAAQIPLGLLGALAVASLARREGARPDHAVAAGAVWLTVPAVFLQLPTNYVDVASASFLLAAAYFVLAPPTPARVVVAGAAIGAFLGSKPNAPIGATILFAVLAVYTYRSVHRRWLAVAVACALVIGAESFLVNTLRHGNPIWPVALSLGPLKLPGTIVMSALLESGANAPRLHGPLLLRVARSWTTLAAPPVFDMRYGGFGPAFIVALPAALWHVARRRSVAIAAVFVAALASPDPAVARYVLAIPALAFAFGAPWLAKASARLRVAILGVAAIAAAAALVQAAPGVWGEGPPLWAYLRLTDAERARAVGAAGRPAEYLDAHARLAPGERTLFDASFDLPYLAWPGDLSRRVARIPDSVGDQELSLLLDDPTVRLLVVGDDLPAGLLARRRSDTFTPLFHCRTSACTVYARY